MAAPKQNAFWKLRSKHGRDRLFETPQLLLEAAFEYFKWCDENPWYKIEQLKKPVVKMVGKKKTYETTVKIPTQRPYSLSGFAIYCEASESFWREFKRQQEAKKDQLSQDFLTVIRAVEEIITTQQFEGATVGAFNASIIARKLGLSEKVEAKNTNTNFNHNAEMSKEEIKQIAKDLEEEY